jgi:SAM-dependent methyltransferase
LPLESLSDWPERLMTEVQNEIRTEPRPNCFLCGMPGKALYTDLPSALFETKGRWNFSQCSRPECGLIWLNPAPLPSDLHVAYEDYFTHSGTNAGTGSSFKLRDLLYCAYRIVNYPLWLLTGVGIEKARRRLMFLDGIAPGRILDVGCGDGTFLNLMRNRGWTVDGIDFDPKAIQSAKQKYGLNLRQGDLKAENLPSDTFDAVTMSHVVEHLPDPIAMLVEIRRILKTGGRLVMTTPNTAGIGHQKFGPSWFGIDAPRHLQLFTRNALTEVAKRAGFEILSAGSTSANADIFIGASYTIRENNQHRMGHQPTPSVLRTLKAAWWQIREHQRLSRDRQCGEELVVVCQKRLL